eukprot:11907610-Heterocapsa_arctica.AAC.1
MRTLGLVASNRSLASLRRDALLKSQATPLLSAVVRSNLHPGWRLYLAVTAVTLGGDYTSATSGFRRAAVPPSPILP